MPLMNDRILSLLGLAARGRNLVSGEFSTEKAVEEGRASLVIVGNDASDNTKSKFKRICNKNVIYVEFGTIDEISHAIGKENKAIIGVLDSNFCKKINDMVIELKGAND